MRNMNSDIKAALKSKFNFILFVYNFFKRKGKIVWENACEEKKKRPGSKFNSGLALICLRTTGPWILDIQAFARAYTRGLFVGSGGGFPG